MSKNFVTKNGRGFTEDKGCPRYYKHETTKLDMQRAAWLSDHLPLCVTLRYKQTAVTAK